MNEAKLVVDTNVFFSLLLSRDSAQRRQFLTDSSRTLYSPCYFFVELFKYKECIVKVMDLSEDDLLECLYELLVKI